MTFNDVLDDIKVYEAGKPIELVVREYGIDEKDIVKLASNENPYGSSPRAVEAVKRDAYKMFMYPDDSMYELKSGLQKKFGVKRENIIIGAGSDQVLEFACRAKLKNGSKVLMTKITFAMYEIYAKQMGAGIIKSSTYRHDFDELLKLYKKENPDIIFVCTPNNPTGDAVDRAILFDFLQEIDEDTLVIVDGAYMEYAAFKDESKNIEPKELIEKFPNALYLGTFSKAYGLGGMRVGYGVAGEEIIKALYKMRPPFNITILSLIAAIESLKDKSFVDESVRKNFEQMQRYIDYALKRKIEYIPSYTNFITFIFDEERNSKKISQKLLEKGVIVRDLTGYSLNAIRITIGTPEQNDRLFYALDEVL
ncbi:histidinol-phosphate transaminase [Nitrosophilus alvini]|uniref:histidinol-phosphate transaminase n=1 Tax=Nitrosophilus alvini TaxID=2714855 RepID=UPI00190C782B|nr:histidinol-phosphate transaminase [Nitrosophilus alvini]